MNNPDHKDEVIKVFDRFGLLQKMMALASAEKSDGKVVVECITAATGDAVGAGEIYAKFFKLLGASEKSGYIALDKSEHVNDTAMVKRVSKADLVFFIGGDQLELADKVMGGPNRPGSLLYNAVRENYVQGRGKIIGGVSAGAAVMPGPMVYKSRIETGFDLTQFIPDSHFTQRNRIDRLIKAVIATIEKEKLTEGNNQKGRIGIGIDECTMLVIKDNTAEVVGGDNLDPKHTCSVHVVDHSGLLNSYAPGEKFSIAGHTHVMMPREEKSATVGR
jgi:cyanophycinase